MSSPPAMAAMVRPLRMRAAMGGGVDAAREAGDDGEACSASSAASCSAKRMPLAEALRAPTTADGAGAEERDVAQHGDGGRGVGQFREERRVVCIFQKDESAAEFVAAPPFRSASASRVGWGSVSARPPARASSGRAAKARSAGRETRQQAPIGDGADAFGADQPQAVESRSWCVSMPFLPMRGSVPARRRAILARCFQKTSTAISSASTASLPWPKCQSSEGGDGEGGEGRERGDSGACGPPPARRRRR